MDIGYHDFAYCLKACLCHKFYLPSVRAEPSVFVNLIMLLIWRNSIPLMFAAIPLQSWPWLTVVSSSKDFRLLAPRGEVDNGRDGMGFNFASWPCGICSVGAGPNAVLGSSQSLSFFFRLLGCNSFKELIQSSNFCCHFFVYDSCLIPS